MDILIGTLNRDCNGSRGSNGRIISKGGWLGLGVFGNVRVKYLLKVTRSEKDHKHVALEGWFKDGCSLSEQRKGIC